MYYYKPDGTPVLDATAGLWCSNAGHCREPIVKAIQQQAGELDFAPSFQFAHPKVFELASRVASLAPADLDHVFFCNSGSEAADTALKIAIAYHRANGEASRTRLIGRERGYHGVGFGGISVGGMVANRKFYGPLLAGTDHLPHTYNRAEQAFTVGEPDWGAHLADELQRLVDGHLLEQVVGIRVDVDEEEDVAHIHADVAALGRIELDVAHGALPRAVEIEADELSTSVQHRAAAVATGGVQR